eukprot:898332-Prymnesium_polylepis.1
MSREPGFALGHSGGRSGRPAARDARTPKTTISLILGRSELCAAGRRQRRFERFAPNPGSQNISVSRRRR